MRWTQISQLLDKSHYFLQKVLSYLRGIAALVSDSGQYVTLHNITNTRKRIVIQSLLASEDEKCPQDKLILSLFSERETATVIDFIKNEVRCGNISLST